ncbi:MAG TPA: bifunctional metallophosphatase/5'-nucleotidase [Bacillota bacterium]|jgi:5'-nucleotidase/UDP-sugar diphosphatase|nr:bifunctional metallophosphatase/5'-nucleotidase [Bacillota bacterium]HPZ42340.1 bifunctional metallophosphatase/5'-nucleotidase [Bacillota bacterium]HQD53172.1 bifunctional metallophosphatase/5'-nucleotidase [Bacillota bacterium]
MIRLTRSATCLRRFSFLAVLLLLCLMGPAGILPVSGETAETGELYLTILHTNDEHSAMIPHSPAVDFHPEMADPTIGGYARLATAVQQIREKKAEAGEPVLLFSGGDYTGGSPFSWLIPEGIPAQLAIMHLIGYDAATIGNHEYDYGTAVLARYLQAAGYPEANAKTVLLASNTVPPPEHPLAEIFRQKHLIELENGLTVGLFGLIGQDAISVANSPEPVEFTDQHETAAAIAKELKEEGADLIVALTHSGVEEDRELARAVPEINVVVGGHCHTALTEPVLEGETIIVQAGSMLECLGVLELAFDPESEKVRLRNGTEKPYLLPIDDKLELHPQVSEALAGYTAELNALIARRTGGRFLNIMDTVAWCDFEIPDTPPLQETPFGNFVADAMRLVTSQKIGQRVDFALQANGSIRGSLSPGSLEHSYSKVSFYDLADLIGLGVGPDGQAGYPVVSLYLTGEEMCRVLEVAVLLEQMLGNTYYLQFSGLRYDYNPRNGILFTVPGLDLPVPSTRAVVRAERYTGEGRQGTGSESYVPLVRGDKELYNLVTDSYILSFLPMIGEMLPMLKLEPKDSTGNPVPIEELDKLIVKVDGEELKVWQTVIEYAAAQPLNDQGVPQIDPYYAAPVGRINQAWSIPFLIWPILILLALIALVIFLIRRASRRKSARRMLLESEESKT